MACKEREHRIPYLKSILGDVPVSMDNGQYKNIWENCRNAWRLHNPNAKYHLVIQDDSLLPEDFHERLIKILESTKDEKYFYSLYAGESIKKEILEIKDKQNHLILDRIVNENAIILPTHLIEQMIQFCDKRNAKDDRLIDQFSQYSNHLIYYPLPSIVQHNDESISYYRQKYGENYIPVERKAVWYCEDVA